MKISSVIGNFILIFTIDIIVMVFLKNGCNIFYICLNKRGLCYFPLSMGELVSSLTKRVHQK